MADQFGFADSGLKFPTSGGTGDVTIQSCWFPVCSHIDCELGCEQPCWHQTCECECYIIQCMYNACSTGVGSV